MLARTPERIWFPSRFGPLDAWALKGFKGVPAAAAGDAKLKLPPLPANFFPKILESC